MFIIKFVKLELQETINLSYSNRFNLKQFKLNNIFSKDSMAKSLKGTLPDDPIDLTGEDDVEFLGEYRTEAPPKPSNICKYCDTKLKLQSEKYNLNGEIACYRCYYNYKHGGTCQCQLAGYLIYNRILKKYTCADCINLDAHVLIAKNQYCSICNTKQTKCIYSLTPELNINTGCEQHKMYCIPCFKYKFGEKRGKIGWTKETIWK